MTIHDISNTGLLLESAAVLAEGQKFDVELPEVGRTRATVVWASARYYGCRFLSPVPKAAISAALLRNPTNRIDPVADSHAWDLLEERLEDHARDVDPGALSPATKALVIVGSSLILWALLVWAAAQIL